MMSRYQIHRVIKEYSYAEVEAKDDKDIMELLKEGVIDEYLVDNPHYDKEYKIIDEDDKNILNPEEVNDE